MADLGQLTAQLAPGLGRRAAYLDLADGLRGLILDGRLVVGDRLPPQRSLADALGLGRTTVVSSLSLLRAEGYVTGRQGSAMTVCLPPDRTQRPDEPTRPTRSLPPVDLDLSIGVLPAPRQVAAAAARAVDRLTDLLPGSGLQPFGLPELRAAVAARFTDRGLPTDAEQIVVTQGALHGWDLVLRALVRPGAMVALEQPSWPAAMDAVRTHRARAQPIAVDAAGWHWPTRPSRPAELAYVVTDFHNPTGHYATNAERRALARHFRGTTLCVDETFVDLGDADAPEARPTACFARDAITIGSLSKSVWAGARIGWLRGPRDIVARIAAGRASQDIASPVLDQLLALELFADYDAIVAERRELLRTRRRQAVDLVRAAGWRVVEPVGGLFLWVDLGRVSSTRLSAAARARGVRVPPGPRFSTARTHDRFLRLPFCIPHDRLVDAVARLSEAVEDRRSTPERDGPVWTV